MSIDVRELDIDQLLHHLSEEIETWCKSVAVCAAEKESDPPFWTPVAVIADLLVKYK